MTENYPADPSRSGPVDPGPQGQGDGTETPNPWSPEAAQTQQYVFYSHPYQAGSSADVSAQDQLTESSAGVAGAQGQPVDPTAPGVAAQGPTWGFPAGSQDREPKTKIPSKFVAAVALLALLIGGGAGAAGGYLAADQARDESSASALDDPPPPKEVSEAPQGSVEEVAETVMPSVVEFRMPQHPEFRGSGFILSEDGHIMTNNHVVEMAGNGDPLEVVFEDGDRADISVVGRDPTTDIAVVQAEGVSDLPTVELGRSDDLDVGQSVVAIGSPYSFSGTVTSGIVSALNRPVIVPDEEGESEQNTVLDGIQTDTAVNPGNSGGPLVNMDGQIIGITSVSFRPNSTSIPGLPDQGSDGGDVGIGFAIPIDQARRTAEGIIEDGHATQTYIGAKVGNTRSNEGALMAEVMSDSPAEEAGLEDGDVVVQLDDRQVDDKETLTAAIRTRAPEETVTLTLDDGETSTLR